MSEVVFVDCETTGLDPRRHQIWELALADDEQEYTWYFKPDLPLADPMGLRVGRYYERAPRTSDPSRSPYWSDPRPAAATIARALDGRHLVGAVPSFDAAFLSRFLRAQGQSPTWHYHLIDVEALAVGYLARQRHQVELPPQWTPPWKSNDLSKAVGVDPDDFDRHTALGDARWAKAIYEAVMG